MDQLIFEKRAISSKKYTYLQYSLASALSKSSFFCITTIQDAIELYPDPWYEMHSHRFYSIFWFHSGEGTHIVDFDEYNIEKESIFFLSPDFVIAYPKKYKSYNFSRQECKKQGFSRIGGRACYFTRLFARLPKQQKQPLIIKHLQTYFEKVTKSGKRVHFLLVSETPPYLPSPQRHQWDMYYFHGRLVIAFRHRTAQLHKSETILSHPWRITLHSSGKCKKENRTLRQTSTRRV